MPADKIGGIDLAAQKILRDILESGNKGVQEAQKSSLQNLVKPVIKVEPKIETKPAPVAFDVKPSAVLDQALGLTKKSVFSELASAALGTKSTKDDLAVIKSSTDIANSIKKLADGGGVDKNSLKASLKGLDDQIKIFESAQKKNPDDGIKAALDTLRAARDAAAASVQNISKKPVVSDAGLQSSTKVNSEVSAATSKVDAARQIAQAIKDSTSAIAAARAAAKPSDPPKVIDQIKDAVKTVNDLGKEIKALPKPVVEPVKSAPKPIDTPPPKPVDSPKPPVSTVTPPPPKTDDGAKALADAVKGLQEQKAALDNAIKGLKNSPPPDLTKAQVNDLVKNLSALSSSTQQLLNDATKTLKQLDTPKLKPLVEAVKPVQDDAKKNTGAKIAENLGAASKVIADIVDKLKDVSKPLPSKVQDEQQKKPVGVGST